MVTLAIIIARLFRLGPAFSARVATLCTLVIIDPTHRDIWPVWLRFQKKLAIYHGLRDDSLLGARMIT